MFDKSLNQALKKKQLDIHVRYWKNDSVLSRYFVSQFLGHFHRYTEHLDRSAKLVETGIQTMEEPEMAIFLQVTDLPHL